MSIDVTKATPMMAQWHACKAKSKDTILLFRMGDFYEAFYEDAVLLSEVVDLTLTQRQGIPMAGIPQHTCDNYVEKIVQKGLKVAIAEQLEDPKMVKGLVKRDIVRIITPGSYISHSFAEKTNNFFACIVQIGSFFGVSFLDISTADFKAIECEDLGELANELHRLRPSEILISLKLLEKQQKFFNELSLLYNFILSPQEEWYFDHHMAHTVLSNHFKVHGLDGFGLKGKNSAISAAGSLLNYLNETLSISTSHILTMSSYSSKHYLNLDCTTQRNLELTESMRDQSKKHTLLEVLDLTHTPMGGRLLRQWILQPLVELSEIQRRQEAIEALLNNRPDSSHFLKCSLSQIKDLERLMTRISSGHCSPRDILNLTLSLESTENLKECLSTFSCSLLQENRALLNDFSPLTRLVKHTLVEEPPLRSNEGGIFRQGYHSGLDELRKISQDGKSWLLSYQTRLRDETGIKTLKVSFTHAFGYYIEVSKGQAEKMPPTFMRRQTLVNNERFISPELKEYEQKVLTAEERILHLENELFNELRLNVLEYAQKISKTAQAVSHIDALFSLAEVARKWNYTKPVVDSSPTLFIEEGRHPVIEASLLSEAFTPNDTLLDTDKNRLIILTGPNMAGKSTYIRQVALITLMAQMGSFVPAKFAHIGIVDKIFTRIGASDDLSRGQSTFMVEMSETANILNNATSASLVILDEIGRGTSTYDGIAIAWSVAEHLLLTKGKQAKTLFATHYWELTQLQNRIKGAMNYSVAVQETREGIVFLHKIVKGATDKSYGIHVGELAGLPRSVTERAKEILHLLETSSGKKEKPPIKFKSTSSEQQILLFE